MNRMAGGSTIAAGALVLLSAIAPWATSEGPFSQNGLTRGDGWLAAGLGVLLIGLGVLAAQGRSWRWIRPTTIGVAAVGLVLGLVEDDKVSGSIAPLSATVHLGLGIYLLGAASVIALLAAWGGRLSDPQGATAS
jgi:hypothetical protein